MVIRRKNLVICEHTGTLSLFVRLYLTTHEFFQRSYKGNTILNFYSKLPQILLLDCTTRYHKVQHFYLCLPCILFLFFAFTLRILITFPVIDVYAHDSFLAPIQVMNIIFFSESVFLCKKGIQYVHL